eukprot:10442969-Lingulodinium_polyedra.AAC.1
MPTESVLARGRCAVGDPIGEGSETANLLTKHSAFRCLRRACLCGLARVLTLGNILRGPPTK